MHRRCKLTHLILAGVVVLSLIPLMVTVDVQAQIVFQSDEDENWEIYVMDTDDGNLRNLTNNDRHDDDPSWSPDGKQIVFASNRADRNGNRRPNLRNGCQWGESTKRF